MEKEYNWESHRGHSSNNPPRLENPNQDIIDLIQDIQLDLTDEEIYWLIKEENDEYKQVEPVMEVRSEVDEDIVERMTREQETVLERREQEEDYYQLPAAMLQYLDEDNGWMSTVPGIYGNNNPTWASPTTLLRDWNNTIREIETARTEGYLPRRLTLGTHTFNFAGRGLTVYGFIQCYQYYFQELVWRERTIILPTDEVRIGEEGMKQLMYTTRPDGTTVIFTRHHGDLGEGQSIWGDPIRSSAFYIILTIRKILKKWLRVADVKRIPGAGEIATVRKH